MVQTLTPNVFYRDPMAALEWLQRAFGFELAMLLTDADGKLAHSELKLGDDSFGVGPEWGSPVLLGPAELKSPASLGGVGTQFIRVNLPSGLDEHCARARAAGARITQEPEDQFYGARTYRALDPEGHLWVFSEVVKGLSVADMEAASGLSFKVGGEG